MKSIKFIVLFLSICTIVLLTESCQKDESCRPFECNTGTFDIESCACICPEGFSGTFCQNEDLCILENIVCLNGGTCTDGECECLEGYIGDSCESFDPEKVQALLNSGLHTPLELVNGGIQLKSLYGKIYAGGLIFYLNTIDGTGLVASTSDELVEWGCYYDKVYLGVDAAGIGAGAQNTTDIISGCTDAEFAAKFCAESDLNGYNDWFLPSKDELNLMWTNLGDSDGDNISLGIDDPNNLGGFSLNFYWSSTEIDSVTVWAQTFQFGAQFDIILKNSPLSVRAVRSF